MPKTLTLRLDESLHRRLKTKLSAEGTTFQAKVEAILKEYVDGPAENREEMARQVALAREGMRRYAPALRELAR
jgi:plasmid stability protein